MRTVGEIYSGRVNVTTSAQTLLAAFNGRPPGHDLNHGVTLKADPSNGDEEYVLLFSETEAAHYRLYAGEEVHLPIQVLDRVKVKGSAADLGLSAVAS